MDVTIVYSDGCPNWRNADERLGEAIRVAGIEGVSVSYRTVATSEEAERLEFRGSPTILIDGLDPFAEGPAPAALACRMYRTPDGPAGVPTVEQLVGALRGT